MVVNFELSDIAHFRISFGSKSEKKEVCLHNMIQPWVVCRIVESDLKISTLDPEIQKYYKMIMHPFQYFTNNKKLGNQTINEFQFPKSCSMD